MNACHTNTKNTIFGAKRLIHRRFDDSDVKYAVKHFLFSVINKDGRPQSRSSLLEQSPAFTLVVSAYIPRE